MFSGFSLYSGWDKDREKSFTSFEKCAHRLKIVGRAKLHELGPGDNFINVLWAAFE
jgi:hypothetical protein